MSSDYFCLDFVSYSSVLPISLSSPPLLPYPSVFFSLSFSKLFSVSCNQSILTYTEIKLQAINSQINADVWNWLLDETKNTETGTKKRSSSQWKGIFKEPPVVAGWDLGLLKRKLEEQVASPYIHSEDEEWQAH